MKPCPIPNCGGHLKREPKLPGDFGIGDLVCHNGHRFYVGQPLPVPVIPTPLCTKQKHELVGDNVGRGYTGSGNPYDVCLACQREKKRQRASAVATPLTAKQKADHNALLSSPADRMKLGKEMGYGR